VLKLVRSSLLRSLRDLVPMRNESLAEATAAAALTVARIAQVHARSTDQRARRRALQAHASALAVLGQLEQLLSESECGLNADRRQDWRDDDEDDPDLAPYGE
jgi:hypothetical protein